MIWKRNKLQPKTASTTEKLETKTTKAKATPTETKSKGTKSTKTPSKTTTKPNKKAAKKTTKTTKKDAQKATNKKAKDANTKAVSKIAKKATTEEKVPKAKPKVNKITTEPVLNIPVVETLSEKTAIKPKKKAEENTVEIPYEELYGEPFAESNADSVSVDAKTLETIKGAEKAKEVKVAKETKTPKAKKPKAEKPKELIKTPTPKPKNFTKEEKKLLAKLHEAFRFVVNMTTVIESQKMDTTVIKDLTLGEVHVLETVAINNNKPMTFIANKQKITVGALTTMINRLVQKGYLVRTRDEMDNRVIRLSITPQTKKILKSHDKFHDDIVGLALDGVTIRDATKVMVMFAEVLENYHNPKPVAKKAETKKATTTKKKTTTKKTTRKRN